MCELSVVILGYKAEDYLEELVNDIIHKFEKTSIDSYEIILVANYDSEKDKTPLIATQLADAHPFVKALTLKKEGRMGWDMRKGLEETQGKYICVMDGDGQVAVSDILVVYQLIRYSDYDLVKTYRSVRQDGWIRRLLSLVYNVIFNFLYQPSVWIKDVNAKPKIITRKAYKRLELKSNDWFTDAEIMIQAIQLRFKIAGVSTVFYKNERRKSFINLSTVFEFIYNLFYYKFKKF
ncbi:MAG: glycosyltransferase family 2 protein [Chitinophagales bacterium]|nr:glycosyltransferase family 2 protein [Chitinophagales bacterium]